MTVYVHFKNGVAKTLHNVESITDNGTESVIVRMLFTEDKPEYVSVRRIVVEPEKD